MSTNGSTKGARERFGDRPTVEYVGPGNQHNGTLPDPIRHGNGPGSIATGRIPKGKPTKVSPAVAAAAARQPHLFRVFDSDGKVVSDAKE